MTYAVSERWCVQVLKLEQEEEKKRAVLMVSPVTLAAATDDFSTRTQHIEHFVV